MFRIEIKFDADIMVTKSFVQFLYIFQHYYRPMFHRCLLIIIHVFEWKYHVHIFANNSTTFNEKEVD